MMTETPNPYASPLSEEVQLVADPEHQFGGHIAGRGQRFVAVVIDGVVQNLLILVAFFLFKIMWTLPAYYLFKFGILLPPPANPEHISPFSFGSIYAVMSPLQLALTFVIPAAAYLLVNGYLLHANGQTVGKKAMGIKIVRKDGSRAEFYRLIFHRYFLLWIIGLIPFVNGVFGLLDPLMIFRKTRYCLHDDIADTVVVLA